MAVGNTLLKRPSLLVFDLDHTLWPFRVDKDTTTPFKINKQGFVVDSKDMQVKCFPGIVDLMEKLRSEGFKLGIASRIEDVAGAYQLLHYLDLNSYFVYKEIYPGTKTAHFKQLQKKSGLEFSEMIFFDDMKRNIHDVSRLGVAAFLVPEEGVSYKFVQDSLEQFSGTPQST